MNLLNCKSLFNKYKDHKNYLFLYVLIFTGYVLYHLFQLPIYAGDTDVWYHLNGGRYILEHGTIPKDSSFFSFIEPPREWVDYYWLFQVLVYKIYSLSDYYGLVFLRVIIFTGLVFIIYIFLVGHIKNKPNIFMVIVFSLFVMLFIGRFHLIRPHMFTYLLIAVFIYILDVRPKYAMVLPFLSLFWVNIHGIVYPLMIIILMAYLAEFMLKKIINKKHIEKHDLPYVLSIIISIATVFLTPHGLNLTWVPFIPTEFASLYILEIAKIKIEEIFSFQITKMALSFGTVFNIILYLSCLSIVAGIFKKNIRISHVVLFICGIILLTKANRFRFEFALLSLPVLKDFVSIIYPMEIKQKVLKPVGVILTVLFIVATFLSINEAFAYSPKKFPFSHKNLPEGVATFLNKIKAQGRVFNHPNHGGYLQWMLYPKYKIFMDMEIPFLFLNEDIFTANNGFTTEPGLQYIIERYNPQFIIAQAGNNLFKALIKKYPQYRIVFFDETSVLYADKREFPEVTNSYELNEIDPYTVNYINLDKIIEEKKDGLVLNELTRMHQIYPNCGIVNQLIGLIYYKKREYETALSYIENLIKYYPESYIGYKLKADALQGLEKYKDSLYFYNEALKRTVNKVEIYREIGNTYMKEKKYKEAYKTFKMITDPFSLKDYKFFYDVCSSAYLSGNIRDAKILFNYAYPLVPKEDKKWKEKYLKLAWDLTSKD